MLSPVVKSKAVDRILQIPERNYTEEQADKLVELVTNSLRKDGGSMTLFRHQAIALYELRKYGVCFGGKLLVGSGKTLISALAGKAAGCFRPLLLVPGDLVKKTHRDFEMLGRHFQFLPPRVISHEYLSRETGGIDLETMAPDLLIIDEAHKFKNKDAGRVKKLHRYLKNRPLTKVVVLTGTMQGKEIEHFAHLLYWSLRENCLVPCPVDGPGWGAELREWGEALNPGGERPPGDLLRLEKEKSVGDRTTRARNALARRLRVTRGVVESYDLGVSAGINIRFHTGKCPKNLQDTWKKLRKDWERPDGNELVDAAEMWRTVIQLSHGFFYRWTEEAPPDWREARKAWGARVRSFLKYSNKLDTPAQVEKLAKIEGWQEWLDWEKIRNTFSPETEAVWVSDHMLHLVKNWSKKGGVAFIDHGAMQERMKEIGLKFFGEGGLSESGELIDECKDFSISASAISCTVGHNLQQYSRALVITPRASSEWNEQMIGRFHRPGQEADEVNIDYVSTCQEHRLAISRAFEGAKYSHEISEQLQKLQKATKIGLHELFQYRASSFDWKK